MSEAGERLGFAPGRLDELADRIRPAIGRPSGPHGIARSPISVSQQPKEPQPQAEPPGLTAMWPISPA